MFYKCTLSFIIASFTIGEGCKILEEFDGDFNLLCLFTESRFISLNQSTEIKVEKTLIGILIRKSSFFEGLELAWVPRVPGTRRKSEYQLSRGF